MGTTMRFHEQIGIRYGHFYAYTLVENLSPKIDLDDAAVRISLVHYNTVERPRNDEGTSRGTERARDEDSAPTVHQLQNSLENCQRILIYNITPLDDGATTRVAYCQRARLSGLYVVRTRICEVI